LSLYKTNAKHSSKYIQIKKLAEKHIYIYYDGSSIICSHLQSKRQTRMNRTGISVFAPLSVDQFFAKSAKRICMKDKLVVD